METQRESISELIDIFTVADGRGCKSASSGQSTLLSANLATQYYTSTLTYKYNLQIVLSYKTEEILEDCFYMVLNHLSIRSP